MVGRAGTLLVIGTLSMGERAGTLVAATLLASRQGAAWTEARQKLLAFQLTVA